MSESPYFAKCKRKRTDGPTPCLCCDGPCHGDICTYPGCDCAFEWTGPGTVPRTVCPRVDTRKRLPSAVTWRPTLRGVLTFLAALGALIIGACMLPPNGYKAHHPERDIRCDTPARYEAMREGADCS